MTDCLIDDNVDIMCLTETWLNDTVVIGKCTPPGYKMHNFPRGIPDRHGVDHVGIAVIYEEILNLQIGHFQLMLSPLSTPV